MLRRVSSVIFASFFTSAVARLMEESIARKRPSASSGGARACARFVARSVARNARCLRASRRRVRASSSRCSASRRARSASRAALRASALEPRRRLAPRRDRLGPESRRGRRGGVQGPAAGPATSAGAATSVRAAPAAARAAIAPPAAAAERFASDVAPPAAAASPGRHRRREGGAARDGASARSADRTGREEKLCRRLRESTARRARSFAPALRVWRSEKPGQMAPLGSSSAPSRDTAADASDTRPSAPALARAHALARHRRHHGRHAFRLHLHRRASRRREARAGASASPRNATRRRAFFEPYRSRVKSEPPRVPPPAGPDRRDPKTSSREDRPRRERVSARALDPATARPRRAARRAAPARPRRRPARRRSRPSSPRPRDDWHARGSPARERARAPDPPLTPPSPPRPPRPSNAQRRAPAAVKVRLPARSPDRPDRDVNHHNPDKPTPVLALKNDPWVEGSKPDLNDFSGFPTSG